MASNASDRLCPYTEYRSGEAPDDVPRTGDAAAGQEATVWETLRDIEDPEMPVSIVDLGLIYEVDVTDRHARIDMTLTYSGCPARDLLVGQIEDQVSSLDGIEETTVNLVWYPPWSLEHVTADGRAALERFGLSVQ